MWQYDPKIHHRRSIRLKDYDYTSAGAYFVTICTHKKECLFGHIDDEGEMQLNKAGEMIFSVWDELSSYYPDVETDFFIVMPNHIHGIIVLHPVGAGPRACPDGNGQPQGGAPTLSLPDVVHRFKSFTTAKYRDRVNHKGWTSFHGSLWQRNYYEHIIRNEKSLKSIREYIENNPIKWALDPENPDRIVK